MPATVFPVQSARASYVSTWGAPRSGGRTHKGTDIYAERGAPLLAVTDGWATIADRSAAGGKGVAVTESDGTIYYYAHLDAYVGSFPRHVKAGEEIGKLGDSGNAAGTPHLHFEVRPKGGEKVDPAPYLARMQLARAPEQISPPKFSTPTGGAPTGQIQKSGWKAADLLVPLVLLAVVASTQKRTRKSSRRRRPAYG